MRTAVPVSLLVACLAHPPAAAADTGDTGADTAEDSRTAGAAGLAGESGGCAGCAVPPDPLAGVLPLLAALLLVRRRR
ncbi:MAG: hypothetical protein JXB39_12280 [Deltaproteobacteria bacterium]|nr:hypothetical protein [Deltaproteobacteria bacterium]